MPVTTRPATEDDAEPVAHLLSELGYPTSKAQALERLRDVQADPYGWLVLAEARGEVAGLLSGHASPYFPTGTSILRITALVTSKRHRRLGVASALLDSVSAIAVEQKCSAIEVTTSISRDDAHAFYEGLGFEHTSKRYFRPVHDDGAG